MGFLEITRLIAVVGFFAGLLGVLIRLQEILNRPFKTDLSRQRGSPLRGVLFAFTLGMAPWEKESTRLHWVAYLRGIIFHVGTFIAIAALLASPWLALFPAWLRISVAALCFLGALFGYAGIAMRLSGPNERALSLPDDYFSVFLTSTFAALAGAALLLPAWMPVFYLAAALLMVYIPLGKIRHCIYFFYSKFFFGWHFGRRGVIGQSRSGYAE